MDTLLVAGVDTVVGANLASRLSGRFRVVGVSTSGPLSIDGCEIETAVTQDDAALFQLATHHRPQQIVLCGIAGDSSWRQGGTHLGEPVAIAAANNWGVAAREIGAKLTLISSDAVFSGPWMFHTETSSSRCASDKALAIVAAEHAAADTCADALIVRTHAYGWSPWAEDYGWIEGIISALEAEQPTIFDCVPHSTPILATDLADLVADAWNAGLSGTYHIAGAERTNPFKFVRALAEVFDLCPPRATIFAQPDESAKAFAQGETSLHTRRIRKALGTSMPMLVDGLQRLRDQRAGGHESRFRRTRRAQVA